MKKFSIITEGLKDYYVALIPKDLDTYLDKVKDLPPFVRKSLFICKKYDILTKPEIDAIMQSPAANVQCIADKYHADPKDIKSLREMLRGLKENIRLMPQYLTPGLFVGMINKKLTIDDALLDIHTPAGRDAAAKKYTPVVYKVAMGFLGKSKLSRSCLISAAMMGLADAMNKWNPETNDKVSFKTLAAYQARFSILNDMNRYGHDLSGTNSWATSHDNKLDASVRLDALRPDDAGNSAMDHIAGLGTTDKDPTAEGRLWKAVYKKIDAQFPKKIADIFYKFFGLNGRPKMKNKDIAKEYGMSEGNVRNGALNGVFKFLKSDPQARELLADLQDIYSESLLVEMVGKEQDQIIEALAQDDVYMVLEALNKWRSPEVFKNALTGALAGTKHVEPILAGTFLDIDDNYKKYKKEILGFLQKMYPATDVWNSSDVDNILKLQEVQGKYKKF